MNWFFVLGAPDPEMRTIESLLKTLAIPYGFATLRNRPVQSHQAYCADGVAALKPREAQVVFVECEVMGLVPAHIIDHHRPGDPGYGLPPEQYLEGSSLGQALSFLGIEPTQEHRVIAAADHCLAHAYRGCCPGVSPEELRAWRTQSRSLARGVSEELLTAQITEASAVLQKAPRIELAGVEVAFVDLLKERVAELAEASARLDMPYAYVRREADGRRKAGILSAPAKVVAAWMADCQLQRVYGDPDRGFAGGYFE